MAISILVAFQEDQRRRETSSIAGWLSPPADEFFTLIYSKTARKMLRLIVKCACRSSHER